MNIDDHPEFIEWRKEYRKADCSLAQLEWDDPKGTAQATPKLNWICVALHCPVLWLIHGFKVQIHMTIQLHLGGILPRFNTGSSMMSQRKCICMSGEILGLRESWLSESHWNQLTLEAVNVSDEPNISWMQSSSPVLEVNTTRKENFFAPSIPKDSWTQASKWLPGRQLISDIQITSRHLAHALIKQTVDLFFSQSSLQTFCSTFAILKFAFHLAYIQQIFS